MDSVRAKRPDLVVTMWSVLSDQERSHSTAFSLHVILCVCLYEPRPTTKPLSHSELDDGVDNSAELISQTTRGDVLNTEEHCRLRSKANEARRRIGVLRNPSVRISSRGKEMSYRGANSTGQVVGEYTSGLAMARVMNSVPRGVSGRISASIGFYESPNHPKLRLGHERVHVDGSQPD